MSSAATSDGRDARPPRGIIAGSVPPTAAAQVFWDSSSTLLAVAAPDLRLHELNPAWARVLGRPADSLVGTDLRDLVLPEDRDRLAARLAAGLADGTLRPVEARLLGHDGRQVAFSFTGTVHEDRWYVAGRNVTKEQAVERGLRHVADFWQQTLDAMQGQVAVIDEHGDIAAVNEAWREVARSADRRTDPIGENYLAVCERAESTDPHAARVLHGLRGLLSGDSDHFTTDYPLAGAWYTLHAARFRGEGPTRVVISHLRLPERRRLAETAWTQAALLDEIDAAVISVDTHERVTHWNSAAERLFGVPRQEAVGTPVAELAHPVESDHDAAGPLAGSRTLLRRRDGAVVSAEVRNSPLLSEDGTPLGSISVCLDTTSQMKAEREALAARNYLRAVTDSMGEGLFALDGHGRVTVMNQAAEELLGWSLAEIQGQRIHSVIHHRHPDGTAFAAVDCPLERVHRDGETVRLAADVYIRRDGLDLPVTITAAPLELEDGRHGCVVVFIDATEVHAEQQRLVEELHELAWVQRLQQVLDEDRFELYAQPILDLATGEVTQSELLLRVSARDGSVEPPARYLATAEEHGMIGEIDRWVVQRSFELAATGMHVELNISASSVGDPRLLADLETWLSTSGADPGLVVFEITETALIRDEQAGRVFVERLDELGCKVALDDFGTGYGGFTYLKQLPVHYLKIDIEFVRDLCDNQASRHVVQAVVNLARGFGLETVAEGVEDQRTLDLLVELGVDFAQGYHVGRPSPLPSVTGVQARGSER